MWPYDLDLWPLTLRDGTIVHSNTPIVHSNDLDPWPVTLRDGTIVHSNTPTVNLVQVCLTLWPWPVTSDLMTLACDLWPWPVTSDLEGRHNSSLKYTNCKPSTGMCDLDLWPCDRDMWPWPGTSDLVTSDLVTVTCDLWPYDLDLWPSGTAPCTDMCDLALKVLTHDRQKYLGRGESYKKQKNISVAHMYDLCDLDPWPKGVKMIILFLARTVYIIK